MLGMFRKIQKQAGGVVEAQTKIACCHFGGSETISLEECRNRQTSGMTDWCRGCLFKIEAVGYKRPTSLHLIKG